MEKIDIGRLTLKELEEQCYILGEPKFRAKQVFLWLHQKRATSFAEMTNVSKELRQKLEDLFVISRFTLVEQQTSQIDGTVKYLLALPDGNTVETVQMEYNHGSSLCISTQVGCRMGCKFCASTLGGLVRSLTAAEMLGQVYEAERISQKRVAGIVLMGIGEPLDNLLEVLRFLELVNSPHGKELGLRHITVSTCGMAKEIYRLADCKLPITLAVSLHAPDDTRRSAIMPVNRSWNIAELLTACRYYIEQTGRRITFEYALIQGVNDTREDAVRLADLLQGMLAHVNLIPINPVVETTFRQSGNKTIKAFAKLLETRGIPATVRRELGRDIAAACGQLRRKEQKNEH